MSIPTVGTDSSSATASTRRSESTRSHTCCSKHALMLHHCTSLGLKPERGNSLRHNQACTHAHTHISVHALRNYEFHLEDKKPFRPSLSTCFSLPSLFLPHILHSAFIHLPPSPQLLSVFLSYLFLFPPPSQPPDFTFSLVPYTGSSLPLSLPFCLRKCVLSLSRTHTHTHHHPGTHTHTHSWRTHIHTQREAHTISFSPGR